MNNAVLLKKISSMTGITQTDSAKVLKAFSEIVIQEVKAKGKVNVANFGSFTSSYRNAKKSKNLQGKEVIIPEHYVPLFKAGKKFKAALAENQKK